MSASKQNPKSLTRFLCWSLATSTTSLLNSAAHCPELLDSLFTAISHPFISIPCKLSIYLYYKHVYLSTWGLKSVNYFSFLYQIFVFTSAFDAQILRMLDLKFRRCYSKIYHSHSFPAWVIERGLTLMNTYETENSAYIPCIHNQIFLYWACYT